MLETLDIELVVVDEEPITINLAPAPVVVVRPYTGIGQFTVKAPHHYRCHEGERLFAEWNKAMETHDRDTIFYAMRAYFTHVNGTSKKDACMGCNWY